MQLQHRFESHPGRGDDLDEVPHDALGERGLLRHDAPDAVGRVVERQAVLPEQRVGRVPAEIDPKFIARLIISHTPPR